ncbi:efflux RND transporter permease subunit [Sphingobacterium sp. DR205]|uniref:efflux RND transporter permease subunit n=1 Tax=Sphingobacterium sp. DR205 TaxID=2713573 RepID=UPI0013E520CD|nr:efflux RND transporter permease subunit [Sphingobacterium sp. DR205]QIH34744.1 efflux RND transporter permease subunit [Sphingobacterium sp. DR205]
MNFIEAALKYKQLTLAVLLMLFAVGIESLLNMPRREDPKITIRTGLVIAQFPGASSTQVEEQVTKKLEQYLFQYEEVDKTKTYSASKDGMTVINVELEENVKQPEIFWNKLRHRLLVSKEVEMPPGVSGLMVDSDFGDTEAIVMALESDKASYAELRNYTQKIEEQVRTLKEVSKVKRIGDQTEEVVVSSTSGKLAQYGFGINQVLSVLQAQNSLGASGEIKTDRNKTPLYSEGYFLTETQLAGQIIGTSTNGSPVKLGDVASLKRDYTEPESIITVNGNKAILLAIQMHEGNNIVDFGKEVDKKIEEARKLIPSDIKITTLVSQPKLVNQNISHFIKEFFLAIVAVIVVVILLLPFRIASVAAMAIPMTVALTFAILNALGIELHQVSLAGLILVLGMVVDDAIVIADNYVELLDEGVQRWTAAWRSAHDLLIPVLAATITIIASFVPMVLIKGSTGEFIFTLPITVAVALIASYFVALFLTPLLCYTFIKKGLHQHTDDTEGNGSKKERKSVLGYMQAGYNTALNWCVKHPRLTILTSVAFLLLTGLVFKLGVRELFFPAAERNQFVVELWMPTGTKLEKTNAAILKAEQLIKGDKRVTSYATFTGTSAPRFYYNFSPEVPASNYALILVNTTSTETTEALAEELGDKVNRLAPDGTFFVKLMQQGNDLKAPVEVRIIGEEVAQLKTIAAQVTTIIKNAKSSRKVRTDFAEDYYGIQISPKEEARRLGFTTEGIAQTIYTGFSGMPISTIYEGNNPINIVFRLEPAARRNTSDLQNVYLHSPLTNAEVPLRQLADLRPQWQSGKIMHRNGVKTLTVQSEVMPNVLPAELLAAIKPAVEKLKLPSGCRIEYGGEEGGKEEVESDMVAALSISLILIFLILLFQFKNIKEALIIMATIPLSLFGAILGLALTGNNFSFTAFIGLISLSGIVVRNAIILVDYTNILLKDGIDIKTAAITAAQRRLRPIFLTAMAAAVGVLPMIISKSPMWAPLASVLAFGVIWSMIMALLTVPVMYIAMIKKDDKKDLIRKYKTSIQHEA